MADYSCVYTLATPGGTVLFNDGSFGQGSRDDLYWISVIRGLDDGTMRGQPVIDKPFDDGGIVSRGWLGPLHPAFEGSLIIQSVSGSACQAIFNQMEADLRDALNSIVAPASGTLSWTPAGGGAESLTVYKETPVEFLPTDNYRTRSFSFGLATTAASY